MIRKARGAAGRGLVLRLLLIGGALVPPAVTATEVVRHSVNVPFWDEWELVPLFAKLNAGQLGLLDLLAPHNEHRILFPRIVLLTLARLTHWNVAYEGYLNLGVAFLTFLLLWHLARLTLRDLAPGLARWLGMPIALLTFSLAQWENWLSGFQVAFLLNVFGAVLAVWAPTRWPGDWRGLAGGYAGALIAMFSLASGLTLFALVPLAAVLGGEGKRARILVGGVLVAAVVAGAYFAHYEKPRHHPELSYVLGHPSSFVSYVLTYLGGPLSPWSADLAPAFGLIGCLALGGTAAWLFYREPAAPAAIAPWLLLATYAILSAVATGVARSGFGSWQALASRYVTVGVLLWVSVVVVGALAVTRRLASLRAARPAAVALVCLASALATLLAIGYARTHVRARAEVKARQARLLDAEECVLYYRQAPDACLAQLYPVAESVRERAALLERLGLGPFASANRPAPLSSYEIRPPRSDATVGQLDVVTGGADGAARVSRRGSGLIVGWAVDPTSQRPAERVLVIVDGEVVGQASVRQRRADVARTFDRAEWLRSGWTYRLRGFRLPPGAHEIDAYVVLADGKALVKLPGGGPILVTE